MLIFVWHFINKRCIYCQVVTGSSHICEVNCAWLVLAFDDYFAEVGDVFVDFDVYVGQQLCMHFSRPSQFCQVPQSLLNILIDIYQCRIYLWLTHLPCFSTQVFCLFLASSVYFNLLFKFLIGIARCEAKGSLLVDRIFGIDLREEPRCFNLSGRSYLLGKYNRLYFFYGRDWLKVWLRVYRLEADVPPL